MKKILAIFCFLLIAGACHADAGYKVIKRLPVGGDGGWDYLTVDGAAQRLYISRGTHVMVVNLKNDKVAGEIPDTPGVHGIAIAREFNRGFTSNGRADSSTIFDLKTLKVLGQVKTGQNPDGILYDPYSKAVFTFNGKSSDTTAFSAATGKVLATIPLGGKPETAASDGKGKIYVNIESTGEVAEIDTAKFTVIKRFKLDSCDEPTGMAFDAKNRRVFSGCHSKIMTVLDAEQGKVIATVPIGEGVDANAFDNRTKLAFSSNGEGTLTVARESSPGKYEVVQTVATQKGSRTMALDPVTHKIYLAAAKFNPPPAPTPDKPHPRPEMIPGSFEVLVVGK